MFNVEEINKKTADRYHSENPNAQITNVKIIKGHGWYTNKIGQTFEIWNIPDKFHSELFKTNAYYIADGEWEWMGLVNEGDVEFL